MRAGVTAVMLPELDFQEQIDLCVAMGLRYYQYRPRVVDAGRRKEAPNFWGVHRFDLTPQRLLAEGPALTAQLRSAGLEPWGTVPVCPIDLPDEEIDLNVLGCAAAQARCMRIGLPVPARPFGYAAHLDAVITRVSQIIDRISAPAGIKLVFETHAHSFGTSPALAFNVCRSFSPDRIGVIFDLCNFAREGELQPNLAVSVLSQYIDCVHIGGSRRVEAERDAQGFRQLKHTFCAMRDSDLHLPTWLRALAHAGVDVPIIIEDFDPTLSPRDRLKRDVDDLRVMAAEVRS